MDRLIAIWHSARSLARTPGFTLATVLTVAIGIGSNAAVLAFMNGLLTSATPLVTGGATAVSVFAMRDGARLGLLSHDEYVRLSRQKEVFGVVGASRETRHSVRVGDTSEIATVATVNDGARRLLGLPQDGGIALSREFLRRHRRGRSAAPDAHVVVDGAAIPLAGAAAAPLEGLFAGRPVDLWLVSADEKELEAEGKGATLFVVATLRPGVSRRAAQAAVDALFEADAAVMLVPYTGLTPEMQQGMTRLATLLRSAAGAVFVIACANLAVFLLSRAASRSRDTSLRMALGATRRRLANAVLVEGTLIAVAGATAGALVALWTSDIVPALLFAADAESLTFTPNVGALVASAALSSVLIVAFGMVPLLENRHDTPGAVLRREPRQPSKPLARLRAALVVIQISTCCALVISAVALTGALDRAVRTTAAERLGRPILATVESRWRFERPDLGREYFRAVEQTLAADPRILSLAWTSRLPGAPALWSPVIVEPPALPARTVTLIAGAFTRDSLDEVVLPPVRGRMFGRVDTANSCKVAVALQGTADSLFGDAVGRVVYNTSGEPIEIVGTVQRAAPPGEKRPDGADIYLYGEQGLLSTPSAKVDLGVPVLPPPGRALLDTRAVSHNYFSSMGLSLRAGTLFDAVPSGRFCRVAVINQQAADTYFAGNAVGGAVIDGSGIRTAIVGVVEDPPVRTTQRRPEPSMYLPMEQEFSPKMHLILGSEDASADLQALVLQRVLAIDGGRSDSTSVMSLDERLRATALAAERIAALLFSAASASALAIGILGLYRVLTDDVLVRQREIAVRSAVGAQRWRLIAMVAAHGARLLAIGAALGTLAALLLTRWLGVGLGEESGPMPWLAGPGLLAIAGLAASVLPARRILAVDPLVAMRHE